MAKDIFIRPKKVVGGALVFFGAMVGSDEVVVVLMVGKEQKLCKLMLKRYQGRREQESSEQQPKRACLPCPCALTFVGWERGSAKSFLPFMLFTG